MPQRASLTLTPWPAQEEGKTNHVLNSRRGVAADGETVRSLYENGLLRVFQLYHFTLSAARGLCLAGLKIGGYDGRIELQKRGNSCHLLVGQL